MQASTLPNVGQQGFIVYEDTNPAGFLQIEGIGVENNTVYQRASLLATHPELRSINLINSILQHLKDTQNTNFNYVYNAKATYKTLYTGLKKPSVEKWLKKKGVIYTFNDSLIEHSPTDDYIPMTLEFIKQVPT